MGPQGPDDTLCRPGPWGPTPMSRVLSGAVVWEDEASDDRRSEGERAT
ncbi:hypothetical protein [Ornithinimicrobium kibberense]